MILVRLVIDDRGVLHNEYQFDRYIDVIYS